MGVSIYPEDCLVLGAIAVSVLDSNLGFADTSQTTDRTGLCKCHRFLAVKGLLQMRQDLLTAGEIEVAQVWNIPDGREDCRFLFPFVFVATEQYFGTHN